MPASPITIPAEYRSPDLRYPAKSDRNRYSAPIGKALLSDLTDRARNIFCTLVEAYLETGNPIGARPLAKHLSLELFHFRSYFEKGSGASCTDTCWLCERGFVFVCSADLQMQFVV